MQYLAKHWRGELPLVVSFWVNLVLINLIIVQVRPALQEYLINYDPITGAQASVIVFLLSVFVIYPWQIIGTWRSASRSTKKKNSQLWPYLAKFIILLGLIANVLNIKNSLILYQELAKIGFIGDEYSDYTVKLTSTGSYIHIMGPVGYGIYHELEDIASKDTGRKIKGVILDSGGGRTYEARKIADFILQNNWNTYTTAGCYSACTIAFAAGQKRYLSIGANIGFHSYSAGNNNRLNAVFSLESEQEQDRKYFVSRGIDESFLARIFRASSSEMWYPSVDELLGSQYINEIIKPSAILDSDYIGEPERLLSVVENSRLYRALYKYRPDDYNKLMNAVRAGISEEATFVEFQYLVAEKARHIAEQVIPQAPDHLLVRFLEENVGLIKAVGDHAPLRCMKILYPSSFGLLTGITNREYILMNQINNTLAEILESSSGQYAIELDLEQAEADLAMIFSKLGSRSVYLDPQTLDNTSDYKQACMTVIELNSMILSLERSNTANVLRYKYQNVNSQ